MQQNMACSGLGNFDFNNGKGTYFINHYSLHESSSSGNLVNKKRVPADGNPSTGTLYH
jgi:hypothetical protein